MAGGWGPMGPYGGPPPWDEDDDDAGSMTYGGPIGYPPGGRGGYPGGMAWEGSFSPYNNFPYNSGNDYRSDYYSGPRSRFHRSNEHMHNDWLGNNLRDYYRLGGHHNIYQCCPPEKKEEKKKEDEKKKPGPSNKKAFFLVRQKNSKCSKCEWKGYCEHMPAKTHAAKASNPFFYLFT